MTAVTVATIAACRKAPYRGEHRDGAFTSDEITSAGHKFFGSVSQGLAKVIEQAFKRQGRPNGYILGEEAGGAFVAGLRYGEGHSTPEMPGPTKSIGKVHQSVGMLVLRAPKSWSWCMTCEIPTKFSNVSVA